MTQQWSVGLFKCHEDTSVCLLGVCCGCYLFGQNAEQIDGSNKIQMCIAYGCLSGCCASCILQKPRRQKLRMAYNLVEEPNDLLATCIVNSCANCQEARELKAHGARPGVPITTTQPR